MTDEKMATPYEEWGFWKKITRRKLKNYLFLNKKLQFNFALLLAIVGAFNVLYFSVLFYFYSQHIFLLLAQLVPTYAMSDKIFQAEYQIFVKTIIFAGAFEVVMIVLLGLFFSHRIAGPLFVFSNRLKDIARGEIPKEVHLRKNDLLLDFADQMNEAINRLAAQRAELELLLQSADSAEREAIKEKLRKMTSTESIG